jgi:hypothetical protein
MLQVGGMRGCLLPGGRVSSWGLTCQYSNRASILSTASGVYNGGLIKCNSITAPTDTMMDWATVHWLLVYIHRSDVLADYPTHTMGTQHCRLLVVAVAELPQGKRECVPNGN